MASLLLAQSALGTLLVNEDFEGTGIPSGWHNNAGTPNFDYSAVPLVGSQSLQCVSNSAYNDNALLNVGEFWFMLYLKVSTKPSSAAPFLTFITGSTTGILDVYINTDGTLTVSNNDFSVLQTTSDSLSDGTVYNVWGHYKKGSGSNAVAEISFDVAGNARPNSGTKWAGGSTGTHTTNLALFALGSGTTVWDNVQVSDTDVFGGGGATPTPTASPFPSNRFFLFPQ